MTGQARPTGGSGRRWPGIAEAWQRLAKEGFPFMPRPGAQPVRRVRHLARRAFFAGHPPWLKWLLHAAMTLAWPVGALLDVRRCLPRTPEADRPRRRRDWIRRAGHMLARAWIDNVPPPNYVTYRLHDPAGRDRIAGCLFQPEIRALTARLNRLTGAAGDDVQDKARFADLCRMHGLPCIPTLAVFRAGGGPQPVPPFPADGPDLWVKDLAGSRGSGAACWRRAGAVYRHDWDGRLCDPDELVAAWRRRDCIIQPCLENHPSLAPLSNGALVDFRVVSGIFRDGRVAVVAALAQLPSGGWPAIHIFATVEADGEIRSPRLGGRDPVVRHPDSGATITGAVVPFWQEVLDLVVRAHGQVPEFSRFVFLGWDVAITDRGPLLIEANSGWSGVNHQLGDGVPLGLTPLTAIALDHLEGAARCG